MKQNSSQNQQSMWQCLTLIVITPSFNNTDQKWVVEQMEASMRDEHQFSNVSKGKGVFQKWKSFSFALQRLDGYDFVLKPDG